jgi:hypothetical protein
MKPFFLILAILTNAVLLHAQGTLFFTTSFSGANEVPPNASTSGASMTFELVDATINCSVLVIGPLQATAVAINGPAFPGTVAPVLFNLPFQGTVFPDPITGVGGPSYHVGSTITASQIADLEAGKWYVNIDSAAFPNGELRGQLVPVPEPSSLALLALSGGLLIFPAFVSQRARRLRGEPPFSFRLPV